jgi:hypothetical protein
MLLLLLVDGFLCDSDACSCGTACRQISRGGAFDLQDTRFSISDCIFNSNQVFGGFGGSINLEVSSRGEVTNCTFEGNQAYSTYIYKAQGGAISALTESRLNISHCSFVKNIAAPQYISASSPLTYSGVGGAIIIQTAQLNVQHSHFEMNAVSAAAAACPATATILIFMLVRRSTPDNSTPAARVAPSPSRTRFRPRSMTRSSSTTQRRDLAIL